MSYMKSPSSSSPSRTSAVIKMYGTIGQNDDDVFTFDEEVVLEPIDAGNFGAVFKAAKKNGNTVAVKIMHFSDKETEQAMRREIKQMADLRHKHIVRLLGEATVGDKVGFVMPFLKKGCLLTYMKNNDYMLKTAIEWCRQIAEGMKYLVSKGIIHGDLAARNCMLIDELNCCVGDFGLSHRVNGDSTYYNITDITRTPIRWYDINTLDMLRSFAPNRLRLESLDVWSFGIVMHEIFNKGQTPYSSRDSNEDVYNFLHSRRRMGKPNSCPETFYQLMLRAWLKSTNLRLTFDVLCFTIPVLYYQIDKVTRSTYIIKSDDMQCRSIRLCDDVCPLEDFSLLPELPMPPNVCDEMYTQNMGYRSLGVDEQAKTEYAIIDLQRVASAARISPGSEYHPGPALPLSPRRPQEFPSDISNLRMPPENGASYRSNVVPARHNEGESPVLDRGQAAGSGRIRLLSEYRETESPRYPAHSKKNYPAFVPSPETHMDGKKTFGKTFAKGTELSSSKRRPGKEIEFTQKTSTQVGPYSPGYEKPCSSSTIKYRREQSKFLVYKSEQSKSLHIYNVDVDGKSEGRFFKHVKELTMPFEASMPAICDDSSIRRTDCVRIFSDTQQMGNKHHYILNLETMTFQQPKHDNIDGRSSFATVFTPSHGVIIIGGKIKVEVDQCRVLRSVIQLQGHCHASLPSMTYERASPMVAFEQNSNRLFVFGGFNLYGEPLAKLEFLDMSAKHMVWVRVKHTQLMERACGNICMLNNDLFVVGGTRSNDDKESNANLELEMYKTATKELSYNREIVSTKHRICFPSTLSRYCPAASSDTSITLVDSRSRARQISKQDDKWTIEEISLEPPLKDLSENYSCSFAFYE